MLPPEVEPPLVELAAELELTVVVPPVVLATVVVLATLLLPPVEPWALVVVAWVVEPPLEEPPTETQPFTPASTSTQVALPQQSAATWQG